MRAKFYNSAAEGGYYVFTMSCCPDVCPVVVYQHKLVQTAGGAGESITHMLPRSHYMTAGGLQLWLIFYLFQCSRLKLSDNQLFDYTFNFSVVSYT